MFVVVSVASCGCELLLCASDSFVAVFLCAVFDCSGCLLCWLMGSSLCLCSACGLCVCVCL